MTAASRTVANRVIRRQHGGAMRQPRPTEPLAPEDIQRVITVRINGELHTAIANAAHDHRKSINAFCVTALLAAVAKPEATS